MVQKLVLAGIVAAGLCLFSPKIRHNIGRFIDQLAAEELRKTQLEGQRQEAERRAARVAEIFDRIKLPDSSQSTTPLVVSLQVPVNNRGKALLPSFE